MIYLRSALFNVVFYVNLALFLVLGSGFYFTPRKCHASHAVTGAIGVATAFALPGTVASGVVRVAGKHPLVVLHPAGQIDVEVELAGTGVDATVERRDQRVRQRMNKPDQIALGG